MLNLMVHAHKMHFPRLQFLRCGFVILMSIKMKTVAEKDTNVLILGAGAAGLSSARTLTEHNVTNFIILEGSDRIGGRVKSVKLGDTTVEAGANWVVGISVDSLLWQIVQKYNVRGKMVNWNSIVVRDSQGNNVTNQFFTAYNRLASKIKHLPEIMNRIKNGTPDMTLRSCLDILHWFPTSPIEKIAEIFNFDFELDNTPDVSSCLGTKITEDIVDVQYYIFDERGFEFVVLKLIEGVLVPNDRRLYLNGVVSQINYTSSSVNVMTKSGKTFTADYAIVTFCLGVIKSGTVSFTPRLPAWKIDHLFKLRLENYVSIYLKFSSSSYTFWDESEFILYSDRRRGFYPVWLNHEAEGILPKGSKILQIVTMGEEADRVSSLSKDEINDEVMSLLRRVYNSATISDPEYLYITRWKIDPLYLGSFINSEPRILTPEAAKAIRSPIGRMYFAGEAFDDLLYGYAEEAVKSGSKTVLQIISHMKKR